jgi:hypothetical protein
MCNDYWKCIEKMIFDLPVEEPDDNIRQKQPKNLFTYIKSMKNDNTGIAAFRKDGKLTDNTKEKANILNSQFQKAFSDETTSKPIPVKGKLNYPKMKNITISNQGGFTG